MKAGVSFSSSFFVAILIGDNFFRIGLSSYEHV